MNADSASHSAWRRLFVSTPNMSPSQLRSALGVERDMPSIERIPAEQLRKVTSEHIHRAVDKLLAGGDAPNFAASREYDAFTDDGVPLPPKKVFGLALEEALGIDAYPGHFSSGWGQVCFELLEKAGLWIAPKSGAAPRPKAEAAQVERELKEFIPTDEERSWIEGNPRIISHLKRERQPGLARQKRVEFIAQHGRLFCEQCKLDPVEVYGAEAGPACIEVHHHRVHVSKMQADHISTTEDVKCLCASCHRVLHRKLALGLKAEF
jgi:5-methylcytosine-specific restriction protein A